MPSPLLSVVVPVYEGSRFLEDSLRSVFAQSFRDFELTVVDDASTDDSGRIAENVARECGQGTPFRLVRNSTRQGLVGNWNRCVELSRGKYILLFHQDDVLEPSMLERSVSAFEQYPNLGFVYTGYRCMDDQGRDLPPWSESPFAGRVNGVAMIEALIRENFICCPSVIVPRAVYDEVGPYDTRFAFSADMEMWMRISSRYDAFCCPDIGLRYRLHAGQLTEHFRTKRRVRGELEYLSAAIAALYRRRDRYPQLWQQLVRANCWMIRQHMFEAPREALWALRILAVCPGDVARALRDALLERTGRRRPDVGSGFSRT